MKCVNCMGPEEYTNGLCFQCYLKTVPPGKVIEYNPKKFDLNKQLTTLKVCSKCNREIPQHEPAWMLVGGGYCCEDCRNPGVTEIVKPPFPGTSDPVSHPSHYTQGGIEDVVTVREVVGALADLRPAEIHVYFENDGMVMKVESIFRK